MYNEVKQEKIYHILIKRELNNYTLFEFLSFGASLQI